MAMSSMLPSNHNNPKKQKPEPFSELIKSVNGFFNEPPVRGFLQSIDDFFKSPFPPGAAFHVETMENGKEYIINAELPGVKREQIQLNVQGNYLTISITNQELEMEEDEINQVLRRRQFHQQASRTIFLPQPINEKKIKASYRDGLLQVRIPQEKGRIINIEE
jgi:HSP20 family protein